MSELEYNKEYTYKQICDVLGWKYTTGKSKQIQIKEIESAFEFHHPTNKKTHKQKKSYIFTKQLRPLNKPKRGGAYNTKFIQPMMDYLMRVDINTGEYKDLARWFRDELKLFNPYTADVRYYIQSAAETFCEKKDVSNVRLFRDYMRRAKFNMIDMFLRALAALEKQGKICYKIGYTFTYEDEKSCPESFTTDALNDIINQIETDICNDMKSKHDLPKKLSGRQLLWNINEDVHLKREFDDRKIEVLMNEHLEDLNKCADELHIFKNGIHLINKDCPLQSYHREVNIIWKENCDKRCGDAGIQLTNNVRNKTRKNLFVNNWRGSIYYSLPKDAEDLKKIEKLLFVHYDENFTSEVDEAGTRIGFPPKSQS